jgi:DNA polymerase-3 subunit epsilon
MNREIVLDTETTGIDPHDGHKLVEIGCVELINHIATGKTLQLYINPERDVPPEVVAIHGLTNEFLKDKPTFAEVYSEFIDFIGDAKLVIHNAEFDMKFINHELKNVGHPPISWNRITDTVKIARQKFPGSPANLDALCRRFGIDSSERVYHGALLDSELLSEVYLELLGGRQHALLAEPSTSESKAVASAQRVVERTYREARPYQASAQELSDHANMIKKLKNPLWIETSAKKTA